MSNSDIATAWRDAMLVDAFRRSRRVPDSKIDERIEAARVEGERLARIQVEHDLADVRARTEAEMERVQALRVKAARLRRELEAELKKTRREARPESQRAIEDARKQASEMLEQARKAADQIRKTARQAAEAEVRALLADLENARTSGADPGGSTASEAA